MCMRRRIMGPSCLLWSGESSLFELVRELIGIVGLMEGVSPVDPRARIHLKGCLHSAMNSSSSPSTTE